VDSPLTIKQIACRCEKPLEKSSIDKIARFCQVPVAQVLAVRDMPSTYMVPSLLADQGLLELSNAVLNLDAMSISPALRAKGKGIWNSWKDLTASLTHSLEPVKIVLVGKYLEQGDSYLSVIKSLEHSAMKCKRKLDLIKVDSEALEPAMQQKDPARFHKCWHDVCTAQGLLVPGGFGTRGTEGMILAAKWARQNKIPYLGICLGMQIAVIEFARTELGMTLPVATSEEFNGEDGDRIIISMPEHHTGKLGGTMRLGLRPTIWQPDTEWSRLRALYGGSHTTEVRERHRHRYEVNPKYVEDLEKHGLTFIGRDDTGVRCEIIEFKDHPWFVGVQYHPEYLSRVLEPSKPFLGFVAAASGQLKEMTELAVQEALANGVDGVAINGEHAKAAF